MNRHLDWKELDAYARGLVEGAVEVHLAECGECASKLAELREEESALRTALEPTDAPEDEVERVVQAAIATPRARAPRGLAFLPLAAAAALVVALIGVMTFRTPADPLGDALAKGDFESLEKFGVKAARHATPAAAARLRALTPRILYVEGEPRAEHARLQHELLKDGTLAVHTMLLSSREPDVYGKSDSLARSATMFPLSDAQLREYDIIILGEVKATRIASSPDVLAAAMRSFVMRLGGTLVLIAGDKGSPADAHHAIDELLPVDLRAAKTVTEPARVGDVPEPIRFHLSAPLREGARAVHSTSTGAAVVSSREAGRGRVVFVASDDFGFGWHTKPAGFYPFYRAILGE
jgi:hypothetical protein